MRPWKRNPVGARYFCGKFARMTRLGLRSNWLLNEHDQAGEFLSTPALDDFRVETEAPTPTQRLSAGELLAGRFRIARFIAGGGMGEVYEAKTIKNCASGLRSRSHPTGNPGSASIRWHVLSAKSTWREKSPIRTFARISDLFRHKPDSGNVQEETVFISMELLHGKTLVVFP